MEQSISEPWATGTPEPPQLEESTIAYDHTPPIDLNAALVRNTPATYFLRVNGSSMSNAGILDQDIVIVDRSIKPVNGRIVIAVLDGEMLIRRYEQHRSRVRLVPETNGLSAIDVTDNGYLAIWGVVTCIIRVMENGLAKFA